LTLTTTYLIPGRKSFGQILQGWQINSVVTLQTGAPWTPRDATNDFSGTGQVSELNSYGQLWSFFGSRGDFQSTSHSIPFCTGAGDGGCKEYLESGRSIISFPAAQSGPMWTACQSAAAGVGAGATAELNALGCYVKGTSVLIPPALGALGTGGRGIFRDSGFRNWDFSVIKDIKLKERLTTQFRAEFFNILNHPNFYNPQGPAGAGFNDPGGSKTFGCGCNTPDQASPNPVLGTGANRSIQLGLKVIW
jgi:hypothetical protein